MAAINWRTINIDALDPESSQNFDLSTLTPGVQPVSTSDVQQLAGQIRQLLRGGDQEGALTGALENAPYGADAQGKVKTIQSSSSTYNLHPEHPASVKQSAGSSLTSPSGNPPPDRNRDPTINPPSRNDANAATHLLVSRRLGTLRHVDEVPLQGHGARSTDGRTRTRNTTEEYDASADGVLAGGITDWC